METKFVKQGAFQELRFGYRYDVYVEGKWEGESDESLWDKFQSAVRTIEQYIPWPDELAQYSREDITCKVTNESLLNQFDHKTSMWHRVYLFEIIARKETKEPEVFEMTPVKKEDEHETE